MTVHAEATIEHHSPLVPVPKRGPKLATLPVDLLDHPVDHPPPFLSALKAPAGRLGKIAMIAKYTPSQIPHDMPDAGGKVGIQTIFRIMAAWGGGDRVAMT